MLDVLVTHADGGVGRTKRGRRNDAHRGIGRIGHGSQQGLGLAFAKELLQRGAAKVYAAARNPATVSEPGMTRSHSTSPIPSRSRRSRHGAPTSTCWSTTPASCWPAPSWARRAWTRTAGDGDQLFRHVDHVPGVRSGRGREGRWRDRQLLSVSSFYTNPLDTSYGASKAAAWSMTNGIRTELAHQGTLVLAVHASFIDTRTWQPGSRRTR